MASKTNLTDIATSPLAGIQATLTRLNDLVVVDGNINRVSRPAWTFADPPGADEIDQVFEDNATPAAGATQTYVLDDDSLINPLGGAADFSHIKAVLVVNNGTEVLSFLGTSPLWRAGGHIVDDLVTIPVGGSLLHTNPGATGWVVGAGETIAIKNEGGVNAADFDIILLGVSVQV